MGKTSRELQQILGKNLHIKKKSLVEMILKKSKKIPRNTKKAATIKLPCTANIKAIHPENKFRSVTILGMCRLKLMNIIFVKI